MVRVAAAPPPPPRQPREGEAAEGSDAAAETEAPKSADAAQAFAEAAQPTWTPAPEALVQIETKPNAVS